MPNSVVYSPFELDGDYDPLPAAAAAAYVVRSEDETIIPTNTTDQEDHHHHQWVQNDLVDFFSLVFGQQQQHNPILLDQKQTDQESNMIVSDDDNDDWTHHPQTISSDQILITKQDHAADQNRQHSFSLASLDLLNNYGKGFKMMSISRADDIGGGAGEDQHRKLSVEEILRVAGERFIQFSTNTVDGISAFIHPYYGSSLSGISIDDARDVELVHLLLDAADKVGSRRSDLATKQIIFDCLKIASASGSPIQRVSYYFAEALQEKIDSESSTTNYNTKTKTKTTTKRKKVQRLEEMEVGLALGTNNTFLTTHQELPFAQVMQFAAVQAIIDNIIVKSSTVAESSLTKIHLIDLQIRSGIQWTALMQGLVDYYPTLIIQRLRITAVATSHDERGHIEETGKRLTNFANSLNLPFSFEIVHLKQEDVVLNISTEADETVAVYSYMMLRTMISRPDLLENLMRAITKLRPSLMLVIEVEANHNSPSFVDRFIEALLFYSTFFDCLEDCMDERSNEYRRVLESTYFGEGITNIVAAEGEERVIRNIKLDVWRPFFSRFGMIEIELSESSKYQAGLLLNKFPKGSSCTLEFDAKGGLTVGWKGTPLHSLTVWKFSSSYC